MRLAAALVALILGSLVISPAAAAKGATNDRQVAQERANAAAARVATAETALAETETQLAEAAAGVEAARSRLMQEQARLRELAVRMYMVGGLSPPPVFSPDINSTARSLAMGRFVTLGATEAVDEFKAARKDLEVETVSRRNQLKGRREVVSSLREQRQAVVEELERLTEAERKASEKEAAQRAQTEREAAEEAVAERKAAEEAVAVRERAEKAEAEREVRAARAAEAAAAERKAVAEREAAEEAASLKQRAERGAAERKGAAEKVAAKRAAEVAEREAVAKAAAEREAAVARAVAARAAGRAKREAAATAKAAEKKAATAATATKVARAAAGRAAPPARVRKASVSAVVALVPAAWTCPVRGPHAFSNDWGQPRSGGRRHQGNDVFAARGTPVVTPVAGIVRGHNASLGGISFTLVGDDGNTYFGTHLERLSGAGGRVSAGTVVGYVGNSGNARGTPPHLHFEIHPRGGGAANPYATLTKYC